MAHPKPGHSIKPIDALQKLVEGNKRFLKGFDAPDSFKYQDAGMQESQHPYACILGCADSRVSPEHTFDESHGNLFVTRIAGNIVTPEIIASLEYGTSVLGASVILVLGHTNCGAVHAAMEAWSTNARFEGKIETLIHSIQPAVKQCEHHDHAVWMKQAVEQNVRLNVAKLKASEPILSSLIREGKLMIAGGIYQLETGKVEILSDPH